MSLKRFTGKKKVESSTRVIRVFFFFCLRMWKGHPSGLLKIKSVGLNLEEQKEKIHT